MTQDDALALAKALYEHYQEPPYLSWDEIISRPVSDRQTDQTPHLIKRWLRTAEAVPASMRQIEQGLREEIKQLTQESNHNFEVRQKQSEVIRKLVDALRAFNKDHPTLESVWPSLYQDWSWICEFCYARAYTRSLPASWDLVWQSAVCYDCRKRIAMTEGGYTTVKGGAYAEIPDPRTYHRKP